jgi:glycosyltransferase involved in cell wall biosynthesis
VKILHVPFSFHPDPVGGTEVYVDALARRQQHDGLNVVVAAPGNRQEHYEHRSVPVWRFPAAGPVGNLRDLYGGGDVSAAESFAKILDRERPELVHLHAFTRGVSLRLVREAKRRDIPVVFSYHTPTVSCQRGTLLRWGTEVCDGSLHLTTCTQCSLHGAGLNRTASLVAGWIPVGVGRMVGSAGLSGRIWTAVRMTELVALQQATFRRLMEDVDHIVAMCHWVKDLLVCNGVPAARITVSRQGLSHSEHEKTRRPDRARVSGSPLKMMFVGRLDPTKGVHLLIEAVKAAPKLAVTLDIYGATQGDAGAAYGRRLKQSAEPDGRITFRCPIPNDEVVTRMRSYDVLAVPSQSLETGPLVILEAFAARLPVLGSNLGGIAELVTDGVTGLLVEPRSAAAWRAGIERVYRDPGVLSRLSEAIQPPRSIGDVAADMAGVYRGLSKPSSEGSELDAQASTRSTRQLERSSARA